MPGKAGGWAKPLKKPKTAEKDLDEAVVFAPDADEGPRDPGLLLLLARVCSFMETNALAHVMESLAATFPGQGGSSGSGQPPAFVAGEVARWARTQQAYVIHPYLPSTHPARPAQPRTSANSKALAL